VHAKFRLQLRERHPSIGFCWDLKCFPTFFTSYPKSYPDVGSLSRPLSRTNNNIVHINAHLIRLHTQLKGNRWQKVIINFNATVVINLCNRLSLFSLASLCSMKCVVVGKALIEQKKQPITQIKRLHYPIWVIYPQVGNQCCTLLQLDTLCKLYLEAN